MADNESHLRFTFQYNRNELEQARRTIAQLRSELKDWAQVEKQLIAEAQRYVVAQRRQDQATQASSRTARELTQNVKRNAEALREMGQAGQQASQGLRAAYLEAKRLNEQRVQKQEARRNAAVQAGGRGLTAVAGLASSLGGNDIANAVRTIEDVVQTLDDVPDAFNAIKGSLGAVLGVAGPVALAIGGISLAFSEYERKLEEAKGVLDNAIDINQRYYDAVENFTSAQVQSEIDRLTKHNERLRMEMENIGVAAVFSRERFDEINKELSDNQALIQRYENGLAGGAFAMNDAAEAAELLKQREEELAQKRKDILVNLVNVELQTQLRYGNASSATIKQRLTDIQNEIDLRNESSHSLELGSEAWEANNEAIRLLIKEQQTLNGSLLRDAVAREEATRATEAYAAKVEKLKQAQEDAAKAQEEIITLTKQHEAALEEIAAARREAEDKARADATEAIGDAEHEADQARIEAVRKAQQELLKLEAEHRIKQAQIIRNANRSINQAIADRNVVAADQAKQQRDDALADEKIAFEQRKAEINEAYKDEIRLIDQRLNDQQRTIARNLQKQLDTARDAAEKALRLEQQKHDAEIQQHQRALEVLARIEAQKTTVSVKGATDTLTVVSKFWQNMLSMAQAAMNSATGGQSPAGQAPLSGGKTVPTFDTGGIVTRSGLAKVHAGEIILNQKQQQNLGFTFVINATNKAAIRKQVNEQLNKLFSEVGI